MYFDSDLEDCYREVQRVADEKHDLQKTAECVQTMLQVDIVVGDT